MKRTILALIVLTATVATASENVHEHGRATVEYRGKDLRVVAAYDYSQMHHAGEWLVIELGVKTTHAQWLRPHDLLMVTPDGQQIEAPTQRAVARGRKALLPVVQSARAFGTETLDRVFGCVPAMDSDTIGGIRQYRSQTGCKTERLWSLYGGPTSGYVAINDFRITRLMVYFQAPEWRSGRYTLIVRGKRDTARLPLDLRGPETRFPQAER